MSATNRRDFFRTIGAASAFTMLPHATVSAQARKGQKETLLSIDPKPRFDLSPYLYMQFMEPLGTTDGSVDAAWDFRGDRWREDVVEITQELAPTLMRWGGCFISYYKWKEGVGPRRQRPPMINQLWGGIYNNQVGTHEFVDFCRRVGADPLVVVNFESDGRKHWAVSPWGKDRKGTAEEACEWVEYCNDPASKLRKAHGVKDPYGVKMWQIGNETSYDRNGFDVETAARKTLQFARAMRTADPSIDIIGWGGRAWVPRMAEIAGGELQYLAFHNGLGDGGAGSPLHGIEYHKDPDKTWAYLLKACKSQEKTIDAMRQRVAKYKIPLALTECHYFLRGRNRCEVLSSWAAGVANACTLNVHERNGDILKIATLADFCGTRWQNNAVMIPVPGGKSFMMPVAMVMSLYRKHTGKKSVQVTSVPDGLDVTASRTGDRIFLHVVNTKRTKPVKASFALKGEKVTGGKVYWFAMDSEFELFEYHPECTFPKERPLASQAEWTFPAASVSAVELSIKKA